MWVSVMVLTVLAAVAAAQVLWVHDAPGAIGVCSYGNLLYIVGAVDVSGNPRGYVEARSIDSGVVIARWEVPSGRRSELYDCVAIDDGVYVVGNVDFSAVIYHLDSRLSLRRVRQLDMSEARALAYADGKFYVAGFRLGNPMLTVVAVLAHSDLSVVKTWSSSESHFPYAGVYRIVKNTAAGTVWLITTAPPLSSVVPAATLYIFDGTLQPIVKMVLSAEVSVASLVIDRGGEGYVVTEKETVKLSKDGRVLTRSRQAAGVAAALVGNSLAVASSRVEIFDASLRKIGEVPNADVNCRVDTLGYRAPKATAYRGVFYAICNDKLFAVRVASGDSVTLRVVPYPPSVLEFARMAVRINGSTHFIAPPGLELEARRGLYEVRVESSGDFRGAPVWGLVELTDDLEIEVRLAKPDVVMNLQGVRWGVQMGSWIPVHSRWVDYRGEGPSAVCADGEFLYIVGAVPHLRVEKREISSGKLIGELELLHVRRMRNAYSVASPTSCAVHGGEIYVGHSTEVVKINRDLSGYSIVSVGQGPVVVAVGRDALYAALPGAVKVLRLRDMSEIATVRHGLSGVFYADVCRNSLILVGEGQGGVAVAVVEPESGRVNTYIAPLSKAHKFAVTEDCTVYAAERRDNSTALAILDAGKWSVATIRGAIMGMAARGGDVLYVARVGQTLLEVGVLKGTNPFKKTEVRLDKVPQPSAISIHEPDPVQNAAVAGDSLVVFLYLRQPPPAPPAVGTHIYVDGDWHVLATPAGLVGDLNNDCVVDFLDLAILARHFGARSDASIRRLLADLNNDGVVNFLDLAVLARNFGKRC